MVAGASALLTGLGPKCNAVVTVVLPPNTYVLKLPIAWESHQAWPRAWEHASSLSPDSTVFAL